MTRLDDLLQPLRDRLAGILFDEFIVSPAGFDVLKKLSIEDDQHVLPSTGTPVRVSRHVLDDKIIAMFEGEVVGIYNLS